MLGMLVMTGLDFAKAKADFCDQIVASLKKFRSRNGISDEKMSAKGWMPPKAENRKRSRSVSLENVNKKYKGKKNGLYCLHRLLELGHVAV